MHATQLHHPKDQITAIIKRIYRAGLTTTSGGNISIKDIEGNIWVTPSAIDKGSLTRKDIMCVKPDGEIIGAHIPSSEFPFHKAIYGIRPDIHAVIHAHPPALVSFMASAITETAAAVRLDRIAGSPAIDKTAPVIMTWVGSVADPLHTSSPLVAVLHQPEASMERKV